MNKINEISLSAVIACYKDEKAIPIMHQRLTKVFKKIGCKYEIIFVNDGSPDNSEQVLEEICASDQSTTAIFHSRNFNSQNAFTSGMMQSTGDAVILLDGDLQDPPELIPDLIEKWRQGYQVVYAQRTQRHQESWFKRFTAYFFYLLPNWKVSGVLLFLLTAFPVNYFGQFHNILAVVFFNAQ